MAKKIMTVRTNRQGYLVEENVPIGWKPYVAPNVDLSATRDAIAKLCRILDIPFVDDDIEIFINVREVK